MLRNYKHMEMMMMKAAPPPEIDAVEEELEVDAVEEELGVDAVEEDMETVVVRWIRCFDYHDNNYAWCEEDPPRGYLRLNGPSPTIRTWRYEGGEIHWGGPHERRLRPSG